MPTQISCINKTNRLNPHERILSLGGVENGVKWKKTQQQVIMDIKFYGQQYYVSRGGATIDVIIATHMGNEYLKTRPDHTGVDNLLSLPECQ